MIAVRTSVCRALSVGRTTQPIFVVRFSTSARQTFTHGYKTFYRAFSVGRTANTNICRVFSYRRTTILLF
jgi:hypothetical protein